MKLILEIRAHNDDEQVQHVVVRDFPATLGRAFNNDVILSDPHIDPMHLRIDYDGTDCTVVDLGSENGLTLNATPQKVNHPAPLRSGDVLHIGHTRIHIYTPAHPVSATVRLQKDHPVFFWLSRSANVWGSFLLALALTLGWSFLEIWTDEPGIALAATAAATVSFIALWSAAWSVAGRLAKHKAHFKRHAAMISLYMIAGTLAWYVEIYVDFLTNENWFAALLTYTINFALLAFLLYGSLTLATRMPAQRRKTAAAVFSAGLVGGVFLFGMISAKTFNQQPLYPATLEPYLSGLASAETVETFMSGNERLFASGEFSAAGTEQKNP